MFNSRATRLHQPLCLSGPNRGCARALRPVRVAAGPMDDEDFLVSIDWYGFQLRCAPV